MKSEHGVTLISKDNSIKKSNELSTARLFYGLTLNQMQLFAYAIYVTQKNDETTFRKADFEKKFNIEKYQTKQAKVDSKQLMSLSVELSVDKTESFKFRNVFNGIDYDHGKFTFEWSNYIKPHILELQTKFIETDLSITMKFKSSFSWTLYDTLKAAYGKYYLKFTKDELMELFSVDDVKSYINNTSLLKKNVLDIALEEVNRYTEFNVSYKEMKKGRAISGFVINFYKGKEVNGASDKQISYLNDLEETIKERIIIEILEIEDNEKRNLATAVVKDILVECKNIDGSLTSETANNKIKKINEKISFIRTLLSTNNKDTSKIHDPYEDIEIPIYDF